MQASDVMTREVITVDPDATVLQAARLMLQHRISGLPVVDKEHNLLGVVSEGDFLRRRETQTEKRRSRWLEFIMGPGKVAEEYAHTHGSRVREVMTADVQTVDENASLEDIIELMEKYRIKRVPVMSGSALVGIVTRSNLMRAMVSMARVAPAPQSPKDDSAIRAQLLAEFERQNWAPIAAMDVVVRDGVVELFGVITDERQREALRVACENVPGVKAVKDHMAWIDPSTGITFDAPDAGGEQARH